MGKVICAISIADCKLQIDLFDCIFDDIIITIDGIEKIRANKWWEWEQSVRKMVQQEGKKGHILISDSMRCAKIVLQVKFHHFQTNTSFETEL